jgi:flagellar hook-length control protein FliK
MMMTTMTQAAAATAKTADAGQPQQVAAAATPGDTQDAAQPNAPVQASAPAQPFAAWLGEQAQAALPAVQASLPADGAGAGVQAAAKATGGAAPDDSADDGAGAASLPQDGALLAAMAMPLMPLTPVQVAQAVQAAQPSGAQSGDDTKPAADAKPGADIAAVAGTPDRAAGIDGARRAVLQNQGLTLAQPADAAAARPVQAQPEAMPAERLAVHAQADAVVRQSGAANTGAQDNSADRGGNGSGNGNGSGSAAPSAAIAGAFASQPAANAPATDTVKLAGPPTAWRQSLQEALGERMNLQVGKGIEQAVIRLEPPQMGRIDIAIRHSAGTLEVNISATNGEVLRQLQNVSDNLRSDLSQRQFTEVAVTVTPAQKNGAAPFGDSQQGRGRRQDREQEDNQPGRALAEADNNASAFSLDRRG